MNHPTPPATLARRPLPPACSDALAARFGDRFTTSAGVCEHHGRDESPFPPAVPDDDTAADMQDWIAERTALAGYGHYEVSAYAQPHRRAKHNLNYWEFGDYLGIGAGAHSKISFPHRVLRQIRHKHPQRFMEAAAAGNAVQEENEVDVRDLPFEFMLNALRLTEGVKSELFADRTGLPMARLAKALAAGVEKGLLVDDPLRIAPTELGQRFLNDLQGMFLERDAK